MEQTCQPDQRLDELEAKQSAIRVQQISLRGIIWLMVHLQFTFLRLNYVVSLSNMRYLPSRIHRQVLAELLDYSGDLDSDKS